MVDVCGVVVPDVVDVYGVVVGVVPENKITICIIIKLFQC